MPDGNTNNFLELKSDIPSNQQFFNDFILHDDEEENIVIKQIEKQIISKIQKGRVDLTNYQRPFFLKLLNSGDIHLFNELLKFMKKQIYEAKQNNAEEIY